MFEDLMKKEPVECDEISYVIDDKKHIEILQNEISKIASYILKEYPHFIKGSACETAVDIMKWLTNEMNGWKQIYKQLADHHEDDHHSDLKGDVS